MPRDAIIVRVIDNGLGKQLAAASPVSRALAVRKVREVTMGLIRRIKSRMPFDTGRAASSWGVWTDLMTRANPEAGPHDTPELEFRDGGLTSVQGSDVPYISRLNEGYSSQAPAGFIDEGANFALKELSKEIASLVRGVFG